MYFTPVKVLNASKFSFIAEQVNKPRCASSDNLDRFKTIKSFNNIFNLIKLKAISMFLRKFISC